MSHDPNDETDFEARARALFAASVERMDGRTRSRLNQARHAALEELRAQRRRPFRRAWIPLSGVAAAAAIGLWVSSNLIGLQEIETEARAIPLEDFELVAESASLELLEDVEFYAWIADEQAGENDHTG